jgi:hypothetical protein
MDNKENNKENIEIEIIKDKKPKQKSKNTPEYNKKYYQEHKEHIIDDLLCCVMICPLCGTTITKAHMKRHQNRSLCKRRALKLKKKI